MAATTGLAKKQRGRAIENNGGVDVFTELLADFVSETKVKPRRRLGIALLPYIMPKLRSVDITSKVDVEVVVKIGGMDIPNVPQLGDPNNPSDGAGQVINQVLTEEAVVVGDAVNADD